MKTLEEFTRAYDCLGDALVEHVSLSFQPTKKNQPDITVLLNCWSLTIEDWVHLELRFCEVQEFRLASTDQYSLTVVVNFAVNCLNSLFVFDFMPVISPPETMAEHRDSLFYVACKSFDYHEVVSAEE